jgi:hypothetical protein
VVKTLPQPMVSGSWSKTKNDGLVLRSGYYFQLYLPRGKDAWVKASPSLISDQDANAAEQRFLWLAWPSSYGNSANRCFYVDQTGVVKEATNEQWKFSGKSKIPTPDLAAHPDFVPVN